MEVDPGRVYSGTRRTVWAVIMSKWTETLRIVVSSWSLKVTKKFHQLKRKSNFLTQTEKEQGLSYRHICCRMFKSLSDDLHYLKLSLTLSTPSHHGFFFFFFFCYSFLCLRLSKKSLPVQYFQHTSHKKKETLSLSMILSVPERTLSHQCVLDGGSEGPFVPLSTSVAGEMDTSPSLSMAFVVIV